MKKILILIACVAGTMSLHAQQLCRHELTLGGGIGLTSLQYSPGQGTSLSLGLGGNGSIGYNFFFNKNWGIGTGAEIAFYNQTIKGDLKNNYTLTNFTTSTPGNFVFNYELQGFEETQKSTFVNIPLMLQFQTSGKHKFYARAGVKLGIPVSASYENSYNTMTTSIYGEYENNLYTNIPEEGLGTYSSGKSSGDLDFSLSFMGSAELGVRWRLAEKWGLYTGIYADYGFNDISKGSNGKYLVERQEGNPAEFSYNSASLAVHETDKMAPFAIGLSVKIGFNPCCQKKEKTVKEEKQPVVEKQPEPVKEEPVVVEEKKPEPEPVKEEPVVVEEKKPEPVKPVEEKKQPDTRAEDMEELEEPISHYATATTVLTSEEQKAILDKKVAIMQKYPEVKLNLEGHTCDIGSDEVNIKVGMRRATNAKKYMVEKGVDASRLTTSTKGEKKPMVPNTSAENRRKNRRVEFHVKN